MRASRRTQITGSVPLADCVADIKLVGNVTRHSNPVRVKQLLKKTDALGRPREAN